MERGHHQPKDKVRIIILMLVPSLTYFIVCFMCMKFFSSCTKFVILPELKTTFMQCTNFHNVILTVFVLDEYFNTPSSNKDFLQFDI